MIFYILHRLLLPVLLFAALFQKADPITATLLDQPENQGVKKLKKKAKIVFLITEDPDNYEAHKTVPVFAGMLQEKYNYDVRVLLGEGSHGSYRYPDLDLSETDLLVVFARRIGLPHHQMKELKQYLARGGPVIGIRTANHAFTVRGKIEDGFEDWPGFVNEILGCENRGYGPVKPGTELSVIPAALRHPIVKNISVKQWHSKGNIYLVAPLLDKNATILLTGKVNDIMQPVAWTRTAGNSRVFYTSLGYPADFDTPQFKTMLVNAIKWGLEKQ